MTDSADILLADNFSLGKDGAITYLSTDLVKPKMAQIIKLKSKDDIINEVLEKE